MRQPNGAQGSFGAGAGRPGDALLMAPPQLVGLGPEHAGVVLNPQHVTGLLNPEADRAPELVWKRKETQRRGASPALKGRFQILDEVSRGQPE